MLSNFKTMGSGGSGKLGKYIIIILLILLILLIIYLISNYMTDNEDNFFETDNRQAAQNGAASESVTLPMPPGSNFIKPGEAVKEIAADEPEQDENDLPDPSSEFTEVPVENEINDSKIIVEPLPPLEEDRQIVEETPEDEQIAVKFIKTILRSGQNLWELAKKYTSNPWNWPDIVRQNPEKKEYLAYNTQTGSWYAIYPQGTELEVPTEDVLLEYDDNTESRFSIQIAAYLPQDKDKAYALAERMIREGYHTYLFLTDRKLRPYNAPVSKYYRIRIGFFNSTGEALQMGQMIYDRFHVAFDLKPDYFVVKTDKEEMSGKDLLYGIQIARPYVIELYKARSKEGALAFYERFRGRNTGMTYIKRNNYNDYRVVMGYFTSSARAENMKDRLVRLYGKRYSSAKIERVNDLFELSPGQNVVMDVANKLE